MCVHVHPRVCRCVLRWDVQKDVPEGWDSAVEQVCPRCC